ncbi:MAG: AraC family transcriptional regulator [Lachnospiraceae bacterium]|nr:AraC family transcriptional regulator [Ruminococcus sp.]MCM1275128.1 AraC family transcriptional regulator [Lachnospiraceae bacterium]
MRDNERDISTEEKKRHSSRLVPFSFYMGKMPDYFSVVPLHWHGEFELSVIRGGAMEYICGDEKYAVREGDIVVVAPNVLHAVYPRGGEAQRYDTVVFSPDMLGASDNDRSAAECIRPIANGFRGIHITPGHTYYDELKMTADNIVSCAVGNTAKLDMLMKSELLRLFWLLENCGDISLRMTSEVNKSEVIRPALEYIAENYGESITIEKLAETVHLSKSYFMSRFRAAAGVSAVEYVTQYRIRAACSALTESSKTVSEISFECGFRNLSNFNRQFRRLMGCTPNEYRKKV